MKRVLVRAGGGLTATVLALALSACSGETTDLEPTQSPTTTPTQTQTPTPIATATVEPTDAPTQTASAGPTVHPTGAPTGTATQAPTLGAGAEALAAFLPEGFPLPAELSVTGDPTATSENWHVTFTVPDPAETFDFYLDALPAAGYELRPGTSEAYSPEVSSGAILASDDTRDVNLLIVDDEVEITITTP